VNQQSAAIVAEPVAEAPKPARKAPAKKAAPTADKKDDGPKNPAYATALPVRDPFNAPADSGMPDPNPKPQPTAKALPAPRRIGGSLTMGEGLPGAGGFAPISVAPAKPVFGYRLSGLITGQHPAAVFTDTAGAQRLVPLGGSLDGDSQLLAVQKGRAVVSFHGHSVKLSLGGTPDAN